LEPSLGTTNAMMTKPYLRDTCFDINIILNDLIEAYYEYGKPHKRYDLTLPGKKKKKIKLSKSVSLDVDI
jgi:hypothetical protein